MRFWICTQSIASLFQFSSYFSNGILNLGSLCSEFGNSCKFVNIIFSSSYPFTCLLTNSFTAGEIYSFHFSLSDSVSSQVTKVSKYVN